MTQRYVNTASSAGGDGTTNATTGDSRAYVSLSAWEAAEQATLTENHIVDCCGSSADTTAVDIAGWTPSTFTITVQGNSSDANGRHDGVFSTSKYRIVASRANSGVLQPQVVNVLVVGIQVDNTRTTNDCAGIGGFYGITDCTVDSCIVTNSGQATGGFSTGLGFSDASNARNTLKNNIVYGWIGSAIYIRQDLTLLADSYCLNNTVYGSTAGIRYRNNTNNDTIRFLNNLSFGNTNDWVQVNGTNDTNSSNNAYGNSDTACPGSGDVDLSASSAGAIWVDADNGDFNLASGSPAIGVGVGPGSNADVPTVDIVNTARSGSTTDVGAFMFVSAGGISIPVLTRQYRARGL